MKTKASRNNERSVASWGSIKLPVARKEARAYGFVHEENAEKLLERVNQQWEAYERKSHEEK